MSASERRFVVLGGPGGYLTVRPVGCPMIGDRYRKWQPLGTINVPRRIPRTWGYPNGALLAEVAGPAKDWALRTFEVV